MQKYHVPGNPPSAFRSHNLTVVVLTEARSWDVSVAASGLGDLGIWTRSTVKTPPVEGIKATSPRDVENVERSSCANLISERQLKRHRT